MNRHFALALTSLLLLVVPYCTSPKSPSKPKFVSFAALPQSVCTNIGIPMIRVTWEVEHNAGSCIDTFTINGQPALNKVGEKCGNGNYTKETAFSLRDIFGNNIPSSITIAATLVHQPRQGEYIDPEAKDGASALINARECTPDVLPNAAKEGTK